MEKKAKPALTLIQRRTLEFYAERTKAGKPPTLREAAERFKVLPTAIASRLRLIEKKGYIRTAPGKSRNIEILA